MRLAVNLSTSKDAQCDGNRPAQEVSALPPFPPLMENGATVDIDPASPVDLTAGETTPITITVTAEDGATTSEYMVNVYRQRDGVV